MTKSTTEILQALARKEDLLEAMRKNDKSDHVLAASHNGNRFYLLSQI
ncbi:hypothetical protein DOK78_001209 [Enterococcus sp. DIV2402]|uniref:Uncharacterized protein n=1 Tax=Candidatus Enterococcus lowellii TaxID=2230877 RepID=A0ABZ2SL49_9ENTE|nr:hypothetical protein [Enterococcus sp. DIV2402]MBO0464592.1 hypothetical protein [Enterococcus sp. DIV2402]